MLYDPSKHLGRKGYVKLDANLYAYGEIVETGISGASGYYALLEFYNYKGNAVKVMLSDIRELLVKIPDSAMVIKNNS